jgi:SPP1 family predicted phage head-tail adaptor
MRAGRLRERITIKRHSKVSDGKGAWTWGWSPIATGIPAEVLHQSGKEAVLNASMQGVTVYRITVRFREDVSRNDQVIWRGQELNIRDLAPNPKLTILEITADTESPHVEM